jgi:hypothetical protein
MTVIADKGWLLGAFVGCLALLLQGADCRAASPTSGTSATTQTVAARPTTGVSDGDLGTGTGMDPATERGSRGVARNLLLAGIATAAVIALLSGVFAFRHKKR